MQKVVYNLGLQESIKVQHVIYLRVEMLEILNIKKMRFSQISEITAKTTIYLRSAYSVYIQVDDWSQNYEQPERLVRVSLGFLKFRLCNLMDKFTFYYFQNITLQPLQLNFRNLSLSSWMNAEDGFILNLKYPEFLEISRKAVLGTRVAEPTLSGIDVRERVAASKIKFQILTPGPFNVTEIGGIVFVSNRYLIKEITYRYKVLVLILKPLRMRETLKKQKKNIKINFFSTNKIYGFRSRKTDSNYKKKNNKIVNYNFKKILIIK